MAVDGCDAALGHEELLGVAFVLYRRPEVCTLGVRDGDLGFALYYCVGVVVARVVQAMLTYVGGFYELEGGLAAGAPVSSRPRHGGLRGLGCLICEYPGCMVTT